MAKWSVMLRSLPRYIPDELTNPAGYAANIKRTQPGDIIACKLFTGETQWVENERRRYLTITIDGLELSEMEAILEHHYDLSSYPIYNPLDNASWRAQFVAWWNDLPQAEKDAKLAWWNSLTNQQKDALYDSYIEDRKQDCRYPTQYIKKRRFNISLADLSSAGVNIGRMQDPSDLYDPQPAFIKLDCFDKKNGRKVIETDGLNVIQPLADNELVTP